jgi:Xaa-Pro aminopeptidase
MDVTAPAGETASFDERRMRRERLERAQAALRASGQGAALLFDPNNVRYATSIGVAVVENLHVASRWALVPAEGPPVLWEFEEAEHLAHERFGGEVRPAPGWIFFGSGSNTERDARNLAQEIAALLRERGLDGEPLGVDRVGAVAFLALQREGLTLADAQAPIEEARGVKTQDELVLLRRNAAACDRAVAALRERIRPGATENELWGGFMGDALSAGAEYSETRLLASGPRTNPWMQEATDRVVEEGDLVGLDTDLVGRDGYLTDYSRTWLCGDGPPTDEQRRLYTVAYEFVYSAIPEFVPGASIRELGERPAAGRVPEAALSVRGPRLGPRGRVAGDQVRRSPRRRDPGRDEPERRGLRRRRRRARRREVRGADHRHRRSARDHLARPARGTAARVTAGA